MAIGKYPCHRFLHLFDGAATMVRACRYKNNVCSFILFFHAQKELLSILKWYLWENIFCEH